jgi:hypothetical protein
MPGFNASHLFCQIPLKQNNARELDSRIRIEITRSWRTLPANYIDSLLTTKRRLSYLSFHLYLFQKMTFAFSEQASFLWSL